jgi:hypothetical protein
VEAVVERQQLAPAPGPLLEPEPLLALAQRQVPDSAQPNSQS